MLIAETKISFLSPFLTTFSTKRVKTITPSPLDVDAFSRQCEGRNRIEEFIKKGFTNAYSADIHVSMPVVLAVKKGTYKAALGVRSTRSALFIEQYLDSSIEQLLSTPDNPVSRDEIIEIGHLFSNAQKFTIPLLLVTAASLYRSGFKYMVFTGTEQVNKLISRTGINVSHLANADSNKLDKSNDQWGTYYDSNPQVVSVSLANVMAIVSAKDGYLKLFHSLEKKIACVTKIIENLA